MTAQELIDVIVMHYAGAPDDEAITVGHWHAPEWSRPIKNFVPQIKVTVGELRGMATPHALAAADQIRALRNDSK